MDKYYCGICQFKVDLVRKEVDGVIEVRCSYCDYLFDYEKITKDVLNVIISGSRSFNDYKLLKEICDKELEPYDSIAVLSGKAHGADELGERYARERGYDIKEFPAPWNDVAGRSENEVAFNKFGYLYWKGAGHFRNNLMAKNAQMLITFWDGKSPGTRHMLKTAKDHELLIKYHLYNEGKPRKKSKQKVK